MLLMMRDESAFLHESNKYNTPWNMLEWDVFSFANTYNDSSTSHNLPTSVCLCAPYLALVNLQSWNSHLTWSVFLNIFINFSFLIFWIYLSSAFPNMSLWLLNIRRSFCYCELVNSMGFRSPLTGYEAVGKQK
jgi:hypothetical protein